MKKAFKPLVLLMLAAALALALACSRKQDSPRLEHNLLYFYNENEHATAFYADGKRLEGSIGGAITTMGSVDGKEGFVVASSALYRISTDGLIKIYPAAVTNAVPALHGGRLIFATATMVFMYDDAEKAYNKLEGVEADSIVDLALSPSGSAAGVTVLSGDKMVSYLYQNGGVSEFGADRCIVAVSDDAKTVYYLEAANREPSGVLHIVKNGNDSVIAEKASPYFELNRDLSEITFDVDGKTHIAINGARAKKLSDSSVLSLAGAQRSNMGGKVCTTILKNTNTMLDGLFYSDVKGKDADGNEYDQYDVYYADKSLSFSPLALGATQFSASEDGKSILALVDNALYKVTAYNPTSPELIARGVYMFSCSRELEDAHILDVNGNVSRLENGRLSTVLATGIDIIKRISNGTLLCYAASESNGTLFALKGERAHPVAVQVNFFEVYEHVVTYLTNYDEAAQTYDLYMSENGEDFTLCEKGVLFGRQ